VTRVRIRFSKRGKVRFISHRDLARVWERALARASVPVAYTEGFSPRPKLHFGLALSVGYESEAEYLDVDLAVSEGEIDLHTLPDRLTGALPAGIDVQHLALTPSTGATSLQQAVTSCSWRIQLRDTTADQARCAVHRLLAASTLMVTRTRKGREVVDDLRPYLLDLVVTEHAGDVFLDAELGTQPRGVRPAELLSAFDPPLTERSVCRLHQWIACDGGRAEPLPSPPRSPAGAP
jgi:radical SAM-linked protein